VSFRTSANFSGDRAPRELPFALGLLLLPVALAAVAWEWWRCRRMLPKSYRVVGKKED